MAMWLAAQARIAAWAARGAGSVLALTDLGWRMGVLGAMLKKMARR